MHLFLVLHSCDTVNEYVRESDTDPSLGISSRCRSQYDDAINACKYVPTCKPCIDLALKAPGRRQKTRLVLGCTRGTICGNHPIWRPFPRCKSRGESLGRCVAVFGEGSAAGVDKLGMEDN